jgi:biotin operon repressor
MIEEGSSVERELLQLVHKEKFYQLKSSYVAASPSERKLFLHRCFHNESDGLSIVLTSAVDPGKLTDIMRWLLNEAIAHKVAFTHLPMLGIAAFLNSNPLLQLVLEYGFAVDNLCRGRTAKVNDDNLQSLFDAGWDIMEEEAEIWTIAATILTNSDTLFSHGFDSLSSNAAKQFDKQMPPLFLAAISVNLSLVQLLLERGVNINTRDRRGRTVLMETVNLDLIEFFISNGIDIDAQDKDGYTAVMHCAKVYQPWFSDVEIIGLLLQHGARVDLKDNFGDTVFSFVKSNKKRPMKQLLENHVAMINQRLAAEEEEERTRDGSRPLEPDYHAVAVR